jgi:hypothetical protein
MRNQVYALMIIGTDGDIAGFTVKHLIGEGIDKVLIDLVPVEDDTADIIHDLKRGYPDRIEIFPSDSIAIWGSRRMTALANIAYERGCDLILPCDSDELFFSRNRIPLADEIRNAQGTIFGVQVFMHLASWDDDLEEKNPFKKMRNKQDKPLGLNKIIARFNPKMIIDEGNHGAKWLNGDPIPGSWSPIEMRHFPYRSAEQFLSKIIVTKKAMDATPGYPREWGVHYRLYADSLAKAGPEAVKDWYRRWFYISEPKPDFAPAPAPYKGDL